MYVLQTDSLRVPVLILYLFYCTKGITSLSYYDVSRETLKREQKEIQECIEGLFTGMYVLQAGSRRVPVLY